MTDELSLRELDQVIGGAFVSYRKANTSAEEAVQIHFISLMMRPLPPFFPGNR
jgi:hypothetical protein